MTPDQLNDLDRRSKDDNLAKMIVGSEVRALVARCRELETEGNRTDLDRRKLADLHLAMTARVAVLREALDDANKTCNFQSVGWGRELGARLNIALSILDPAATALTERLKAAEAVCTWLTDSYVGPYGHSLLVAWRKVKGETP